MELAGRHVVVTGGASGIGRALARRFRAEGARAVAVADVDAAGAAAVAEEVGGLGVACDVSREDEVRALVARAEAEAGPIDLFCSNAGVGQPGGVEVPDADWERLWKIHVMAHIYAARALLPAMLARGEGYLLHTASAAGLLHQIGSAPYGVTKHAAVSLAEWLSITYGDRGIRVSVLCPQLVRTALTERGAELGDASVRAAGVDGGIEPEVVADAVVEALAAERFWVLPHPEVADYVRRKAADPDRWLAGMRKLQRQLGYEGPVP